MRIGLVVNPIAGLGGAVGLKGTDGEATVAEALRRGAQPQAGSRVKRAFRRLASARPEVSLVVAPGQLGANHLIGLDLRFEELKMAPASGTACDTRRAVEAMGDVDLVVFAGGDGTARDVAAALDGKSAMLGIPCGVKMHSGVFAISPEAAGNLLADLVTSRDRTEWADVEIMDIDETALRAGSIAPRLYGYARVPKARGRMQAAKGGAKRDYAGQLAAAAAEIAAAMQPGALYIIGPGTSAALVLDALGHEATILGVDAVLDGQVVARDASADELTNLAVDRKVRIVLSLTGRQGFLLGRGNQQISSEIIGRAGRDGLIVLASEVKLAELAAPFLMVDTGDPSLDAELSGFVRVQTGAARFTQMRIHGG